MLNVGKMFSQLKSTGRFRRKEIFELCRYFSKNLSMKLSPPWKIIFYGTDQLSEVTLKALDSNRYSTH